MHYRARLRIDILATVEHASSRKWQVPADGLPCDDGERPGLDLITTALSRWRVSTFSRALGPFRSADSQLMRFTLAAAARRQQASANILDGHGSHP